MIALDDLKQDTANWINSHSFSFTEWGWDGSSSPIFDDYNDYNGNLPGTPQTFIIDADRNVRWAIAAALANKEQATKVIDELI